MDIQRGPTPADGSAAAEPDVCVQMSRRLLELGRVAEAAAAAEQAVRWEPTLAAAYDLLGHCHLKQGRLREAMRNHLAAVERDPNLSMGFVSLYRTLLLMHHTREARQAAETGIQELAEDDSQVARLEFGLAQLAWLEGRLLDVSGALGRARARVSEVGPERVREQFAYLQWLVAFRRLRAQGLYDGPPRRALFFVSDEHCFGPSETVVRFEGEARRVLSCLIPNGRARLLRPDVDNEVTASLRAVANAIPERETVVFGFGELDCRFAAEADNPSRISAWADRYVEFVATVAASRRQTAVLYGVPAPSPIALQTLTAPDRELRIERVRVFNDGLRAACRHRKLRMLDVHARTATVEGVADGRFYVDAHHLHPASLFTLLDSAPRRTLRIHSARV